MVSLWIRCVEERLTCQKTDTNAHIRARFRLDKAPSIVELGLSGDMSSSKFRLVLLLEHLKLGGGERSLCIRCVGERHLVCLSGVFADGGSCVPRSFVQLEDWCDVLPALLVLTKDRCGQEAWQG